MQAVILAGGLGTRLKSITGAAPKPLVLIEGRPFLEYQLRLLREQAVSDFVFCLGYGAAEIQEFFGDGSRWGVRIRYSNEPEPRGTAGALRGALDLLQDSFFVLNGDTFVELDYAALAESHRARQAEVTIAVTADPTSLSVGHLSLKADGAVEQFEEKTASMQGDWTSAGIYLFERSVVSGIPEGVNVSLEYETFPRLIATGARIYGFVFSGYSIDIGTPNTFRAFVADLKRGNHHVV